MTTAQKSAHLRAHAARALAIRFALGAAALFYAAGLAAALAS